LSPEQLEQLSAILGSAGLPATAPLVPERVEVVAESSGARCGENIAQPGGRFAARLKGRNRAHFHAGTGIFSFTPTSLAEVPQQEDV